MHVRNRSKSSSISNNNTPSTFPTNSTTTTTTTTPSSVASAGPRGSEAYYTSGIEFGIDSPSDRSIGNSSTTSSAVVLPFSHSMSGTTTSTTSSTTSSFLSSHDHLYSSNSNSTTTTSSSPSFRIPITIQQHQTPLLSSSRSPRLSIRAPSIFSQHSPLSSPNEPYFNLHNPHHHHSSSSSSSSSSSYGRKWFTFFFIKRLRLKRILLYLISTFIGVIFLFYGFTNHTLKGKEANRLIKFKALQTTCRLFPWQFDCLGIHSPFDDLEFETLGGYLKYPATLVGAAASSSSRKEGSRQSSEEQGVGVGGKDYLGSRRKTATGAIVTSNLKEEGFPPQPHPIHLLMNEAKSKYEQKIARQSKTLKEAVEEYERRYNRRPPKGFADWWYYARGNNFIFVDEFDSLNDNLLPFYALPSRVIRERAEKLQHDPEFWIQDKTYTLQLIGQGRYVQEHGPMKDHSPRPEQMKSLIQPIAKYLPDMNITFTGHDNPWIVMSGEAKEQHIRAAKAGKYVDEKLFTDALDDWKYDGWAQSCLPNSPLRQAPRLMDRLKAQANYRPPLQKSLIQDHIASMNVCHHPERQTMHGFTLWDGPRSGLVYPLFSMTSTLLHSDLLVPPIDQFDMVLGQDPKWEDKKFDKVVWRGTTTGADLNLAWMRDYSQRPRLCRIPHQTGPIKLTYAPNDKTASQLGPIEFFTAEKSELAKEWFDFQFLGKPQQCGDPIACAEFEKEFTWSGYMGPDEQNQYKYMIDVDGNGWSGRFHRLLSTNSLIFKSTIFPEWYRDHIQPWLHYVPISTDYNDLWEVMAFFKGDETGRGEHDHLAKEIAMAGKEFATTCWRMEDMRIYTYRLLLEYARILYRDEDDSNSMDM